MSGKDHNAAPLSMEDRYKRARKLYKASIGGEPVVLNANVLPVWISDTNQFWYQRQTREGWEFRRVDAERFENRPAFCHSTVAHALEKASGEATDAAKLPISEVEMFYSPGVVEFNAFEKRWRFEGADCHKLQPLKKELLAPGGRQALFVKNHDLWVRDVNSMQERPLTNDGEERYAYGALCTGWGHANGPAELHGVQARWSRDASKVLTIQRDTRAVKDLPVLHYVPSANDPRPQVEHVSVAYPGDEGLETSHVLCINAKTGAIQRAAYPPLPATRNGYGFFASSLGWWGSGARFAYFVDVDKNYKYVRIVEFDTDTGECRVVFEETSATHINLMLNQDDLPDFLPLPETDELIWFSERTGYGHFYLYDLKSGGLVRELTSGNWIARKIIRYIPSRREIFVQTAGRGDDVDPYYRDLVRVHLDTGELTEVITGDADHFTSPLSNDSNAMTAGILRGISSGPGAPFCGVSATGEFAVTTRSRIDTTPETLLLNRDGRIIACLEKADISNLPDGWSWPEAVKGMAADRQTPVYGAIFRPSYFDPDKMYPVISHGFNQPEIAIVPKGAFNNENSGGFAFFSAATLAELGFIVVMVDGRGSPMREKAFYDHSYGRCERASDIDDHVAVIQQLAKRYKAFDLERIGVSSAFSGGSGAVQGLLKHPDFFKAGVATALHDRRFMPAQMQANKFEGVDGPADGYRDVEEYADQLKGKLLLMTGLLDSSTAPAAALRLVDAFQRANKNFDMIALPKLGHGVSPYFARRSWDYLVEHLAGETPPYEFDLLGDEEA